MLDKLKKQDLIPKVLSSELRKWTYKEKGLNWNVWPKFKFFLSFIFFSLILESESLMFPSFYTFQKLFIIQFCNNAIAIIITEIKFSPSPSLNKIERKSISLCIVEIG